MPCFRRREWSKRWRAAWRAARGRWANAAGGRTRRRWLRRCRSIPYDPLVVTAPVVVILAAGQGTRMRSATPKLLHPLCGRPMIEWPVAAAREAGAGKVVVVDGPERPARRRRSNGQVEVAVQEQPRGTADAVIAAAGHIDPQRLGDRAQRRRAADQRRDAARAGAGARARRRGGHDGDGDARRSERLRAGRPGARRDRRARRRDEVAGRRDASSSCTSARSTPACSRSTARRCCSALEEVRSDNAQGELYLPDVLPILRLHERTVIAHEIADPDRDARDQRPGRAGRGPRRSPSAASTSATCSPA